MDGAAEALLLRQLEEQWARLAAAEEALAESERESARFGTSATTGESKQSAS